MEDGEGQLPRWSVAEVEKRAPGESGTLIDVLDRVLDKGIVIRSRTESSEADEGLSARDRSIRREPRTGETDERYPEGGQNRAFGRPLGGSVARISPARATGMATMMVSRWGTIQVKP